MELKLVLVRTTPHSTSSLSIAPLCPNAWHGLPLWRNAPCPGHTVIPMTITPLRPDSRAAATIIAKSRSGAGIAGRW